MSDLTNTYLGQFRIIELIRPGMMMTIYKAYQPALDRFVAIADRRGKHRRGALDASRKAADENSRGHYRPHCRWQDRTAGQLDIDAASECAPLAGARWKLEQQGVCSSALRRPSSMRSMFDRR
ncbi:MAG TPA: hypothetical protein VFU22_30705 [Roseiflexaceae bacterium]|nr:hypothetical protein [Roseiflexaceae bacterium]